MNVLILGGGGREHALAWAVSRSASLRRLVCAPGNAGTARLGRNVAAEPADPAAVLALAREEEIDLVLVGPEGPLVAGVADALRAEGTDVFGPGADGARLEGSKAFAKEVMRTEGVPTARSAAVTSVAEAAKALDWIGPRAVVKADGLAAGKGVLMTGGRDETLRAVRECVEGSRFGAAGERVVLEEWLEGEEASLLALVDGEEIRAFVPSQDHKRAFDGDRGPNTGGMGAYAPYPGLPEAALDAAVRSCVAPVARGLARRGIAFRGVLYAGLMLTPDGPKVLEYNVRFGDPETQAVLPLADGDLLETFAACAGGRLAEAPPLRHRPGAALTVVAAAAGYPDAYAKGKAIRGLEGDDDRGDAIVFHAGTKTEGDDVVTSGGRVLAVTGRGATLAEARETAYAALGTIEFEGMFHRNDIGARGLALAGAREGEGA